MDTHTLCKTCMLKLFRQAPTYACVCIGKVCSTADESLICGVISIPLLDFLYSDDAVI